MMFGKLEFRVNLESTFVLERKTPKNYNQENDILFPLKAKSITLK